MRTPGFQTWRTAGLNIFKPYYLMSFACKEGRNWIAQGMILWCDQDLLGFCSETSKSSSKKILQITKLIPSKPESIGIWKPVAIKEIWRNPDENEREDFLIIEDDENQEVKPKYLSSNTLQHMKKIFAAS